jgi:DNA-binding SARP family transcriptional activator
MRNGQARSQDAGTAAVRLSLLGPLQVEVGDQAVELTARKVRALLAYLALRKALAEAGAAALKASHEGVRWAGEGCWLDVEALEQSAGGGLSETLAAAPFYRGDLLEGLALDEPAFDQWLAAERARHALRLSPVHPLYFPAVLATSYHGAGRHAEAMEAARDAIALDPKKVEPHLMLAACAAALGQAEEARRATREVRALRPGFTLAAFAEEQPYKDPKHLDRLLDQLRHAGLE